MSVVEDIKQKIEIVEVIGQYVQLTRSGRNLRAPCPFHSEKKPSFFVYPEQQRWHCFGACNTGGDVFSFIMKKEGVDFTEALRILADRAGVIIPSRSKTEAEDRARDKILTINQTAAQYFHNLLLNSPAAGKARSYLEGRGLTEKSISDFQLGYSLPGWEDLKKYLLEKGFAESEILEAGLAIRSEDRGNTYDRFHDNIMFPIMDERGHVTGFGARVLDPAFKGPKYTNSPQTRVFDKSGSLYGIQLARSAIRQQDLAVIVEGYMDVIIAHQYGFSNVIAPMGVAITERQINQIKRLTRNIALALDPDAAGEEAAMRCVEYENTLDSEVKVITLPAGLDPDEVILRDMKEWQLLIDKAEPVIEYTIKSVTGKLDLKSTQGQTEAVNRILPIIAGVKAGTRQYRYLTALGMAVRIEEKRLEAALGRYRSDLRARETRVQAVQKATRSIRSNPVEEYILAILLQNPGLKNSFTGLVGEYFENSENRVIFELWQQSAEPVTVEMVDEALQDHFNHLLTRKIASESVEERYQDCLLRLKERYLRSLKKKQEEALLLEAETGGSAAALAKLQEQGIEINEELARIFTLRAKAHGEEINERQ